MDELRFWSLVKKTDTCWLWNGSISDYGYGIIPNYAKEGKRLAHRVSWEFANGPIPPGMCVLHKCDVRTCVNPDHLFLGTNTDNVRDMVLKNRHIKGEQVNTCKLKREQVLEIRASNLPIKELGRKFNVSYDTIRNIKLFLTWKSV